MSKLFNISCTRQRTGSVFVQSGTVAELVASYKYTLECGKSYSHEKGNRKINMNPKTITSLVNNLNNAVNNSAANGYAGTTYELVIA
jgi:hypothetical protein